MISATEASWLVRKMDPAPLLHVLRKVTREVGRNEFEAKNVSYSSWLVRNMS